jgi:hypothetical protein
MATIVQGPQQLPFPPHAALLIDDFLIEDIHT